VPTSAAQCKHLGTCWGFLNLATRDCLQQIKLRFNALNLSPGVWCRFSHLRLQPLRGREQLSSMYTASWILQWRDSALLAAAAVWLWVPTPGLVQW
jgi:hypothetical protein